MLTYPDFRSLPQGVKRLLVASESFFFSEAQPQVQEQTRVALPGSSHGWHPLFAHHYHPGTPAYGDRPQVHQVW